MLQINTTNQVVYQKPQGKVYQRGMGAYYSSGSRPGQTPQSWAAGRVRSFATGKGGARKADADLLRPKKSKKRS